MSHLSTVTAFLAGLLISFSVFAYNAGDKVRLVVADGCSACASAEQTLKEHHIPFTTEQGRGMVPRLYVNGKYIGTGTGAVENYANAKSK